VRRPDGKAFNGLVLLAQGAEAWSTTPDFAKLPEIAQKEILSAARWIRGMERIRGRREIARALMEEQPGLYVKPPAYNPEWFGKPGYHFKKEGSE
jgi:hypothetical protein